MKTTTKQIETPSAPAEKSAQSKITAGGFHAEDCPCDYCRACRRTKAEQDAQLKKAIFGTEKSAQHSPLPWRLAGDEVTIVCGHKDDPNIVASACINDPCATTFDQQEHDAAFIVEACNNYERVKAERDELLAALKPLELWISGDVALRGGYSKVALQLLAQLLAQAKAAITNAEKSAK